MSLSVNVIINHSTFFALQDILNTAQTLISWESLFKPNWPIFAKMAAVKVATITLPLLTNRDAAVKFKQNWITKSQPAIVEPPKIETTEDNLDDSLTSLNWLQNLRIMRIQHPTPPSSPTPLSIQNSHKGALQIHKGGNGIVKLTNSNHRTSNTEIKISKVSTHNHLHHHLSHHHHIHQAQIALDQKIDYKTNSSVKPPYSYSTLIWMAMKESKKNKITLSSIYKWIMENFKYYQVADPSWQVIMMIHFTPLLNPCWQCQCKKQWQLYFLKRHLLGQL